VIEQIQIHRDVSGTVEKLYPFEWAATESVEIRTRGRKVGAMMKRLRQSKSPLYLRVARQIENQIRKGALQVGDRVPSIRGLKRQQGVSVSTVLQAYFWLENQGWIEPRPQSGFYVRVPYTELVPEPEFQTERCVPTEIGVADLLYEVVTSIGDRTKLPLGAASLSPELYPNRKLNQIIHKITRENPSHSSRCDHPQGVEALRRQIARRSIEYGCNFSPNDVVVTCGCMESLNLALRAVAAPGSVIAIESPTYFAVLQIIESLGMKAIEIPTSPRTGMDLKALSNAITKHRIGACVVIPNCHNPLGFVLDDAYKKNLVDLLTKHDIPLIEDDLYADLAFSGVRPKTAKTFDTEGIVLTCSSFSKALGPGFRVGWIVPGRYRDAVIRLKFINTLSSPSLAQLVISEFIESGGYDRYLRRLRETLANQVQVYGKAAARYFPPGTKISRPAGGYVLWVELPNTIDSLSLYRAALAENIYIVPGAIFSASGQFRNHIRISCGHPWSDSIDGALITLGRLCHKLA
jgi:DNA-binding transcriptional MocR family regulator